MFPSRAPSQTIFKQVLGRRGVSTHTERHLGNVGDWTEFQAERHARTRLKNSLEGYGSAQNKSNTWTPGKAASAASSETTLSALVAAGAHMGHHTSRMNPNFMAYAYGERAGITVIDLEHTLPLLRRAARVTRAIAREGGSILFVGTRPDLRPLVENAAGRIGHTGYHVGGRWLPGMFTNRANFFGKDRLENLDLLPDLVVFLNPLANLTAIRECATEHIPTIGIIDSNADPRLVMYAIPANDESVRTAELISGVLSVAGREGAMERWASLNQQRSRRLTPQEVEEKKLTRLMEAWRPTKPHSWSQVKAAKPLREGEWSWDVTEKSEKKAPIGFRTQLVNFTKFVRDGAEGEDTDA
ncbi:ribosomal protein S2 [Cylindrobasidium torrendii FP15055 ss-10]|uniref:Ribosomal protein S2 n=1 Tax=Cylindrobasidium torrendii FP15055 ss-10 TaxID=1314674 RepID=A0A0D7B7S6_9AGAR|nr:ribosomal protein S2 [Cylindrobasidium torrendii FP15055 ss-10]